MPKELEKTYRALYDLVGASYEDHFVFTSSGEEAINHAIFASYLDITRKTGKNHFVTSSLAEAAQSLSIIRLEELGCIHTFAEATSCGQITLEAISEAITPRTALVSLPTACGLTGVIQKELSSIAKLCKERKIVLHLEATHTLGWAYIPWEEGILTFDGQAFGSNSGGLFFRNEHDLSPFILGGNEQSGMRGGSFSEEALLALGRGAADLPNMIEMAYLSSVFEEGLSTDIPGIKVLFSDQERLSHILAVDFEGIHNESLHYLLQKKGIPSSIGGGRFQRLSQLLKVCKQESFGAISFKLSSEMGREGIERMIHLIEESVTHLRKYSQVL